MGDQLLNSSAFYGDELLDSCEQILERHYHHLTRVLRPHLFYGWLRAKQVFSHDDQEEVENYITTCMKAGKLIDIVKTKGKAGFVAFMEVIEYEYPELFLDMTGKQSRTPPHEFSPKTCVQRVGSSRRQQRPGTASADVLTMIGDLTYTLTQALALKQEQLKKLNALIDEMRAEHEQEAEDNASMNRELQALQETVEELTAEKNLLNQRLRLMKEERDAALQQCTELREQKDNFMEQCHQLRVNCEKLAIERSVSEKPNKFVKPIFTSCRTNTQRLGDANHEALTVTWPGKQLDSMRAELTKLQQKEEMWLEEKKALETKLQECELRQQNSVAHWLLSVSQIKAERDQALQQLDDLKKKYADEVVNNDRLSKECRQYVEQFKRMEETIEILKREIDQRNRQTPKLSGRGTLEHLRLCHTIDEPEDGDEQHAPEDAGTEPEDRSRGASIHRPLERAQPISARPEVVIAARNVAAAHPELKNKRKGSVVGVCPFVIYAPDRFQQPLYDYLLSKTTFFGAPEYAVATPNLQTESHSVWSEVIHDKLSPDGTTHYKLTVDSLKECILKSKRAILLPPLPMQSVIAMRRHNVHFVVIVIKLIDEQECCELTRLEEDLGRHSGGLYESLYMDVMLSNDFERFASEVSKQLLHHVEKYTFLVGLSEMG